MAASKGAAKLASKLASEQSKQRGADAEQLSAAEHIALIKLQEALSSADEPLKNERHFRFEITLWFTLNFPVSTALQMSIVSAGHETLL